MRILQVRLRNLNSLTGEWFIDFTHPAYVSNGIFSITGPTGAGKTTILDAICLALYGSTPRLGKVTKSGNEIMSRHTGECFAEVTFETQAGRFRCHWSQRRARKKPDGELQAPKHEISEAESGRVIESRLREVVDHIEIVTGMDFNRFTRSMLLAQGGFAIFLQAPPDERAPILEQITGTEIYSLISIKVHERRTQEREKLNVLQAESAGAQPLSEEEEQKLRSGLEEKSVQEIQLTRRRETFHQALAWLDGIAEMGKDLAALNEQWQDFENRQQSFQPELRQMERAQRALSLEGEYAGVSALRGLQAKEMNELGEARGAFPALEASLAMVLEAQKTAQDRLYEARAVQRQEGEVIKKVREMDLMIGEKRVQIGVSGKSLEQLGCRRKDCRERITKSERALEESHAALKKVEDYLTEHAVDAGLVANLTAVGRMFEAFREKHFLHGKISAALAAALNEKEVAVAEYSEAEARHVKSVDELKNAEREHDELGKRSGAFLKGRELREWRDELEVLKQRKYLLDETGKVSERIVEIRATLEELKTRHRVLTAEQASLTELTGYHLKKKSDCEQEIGHLETQVVLLHRIRDLEGERAHLQDGKPCPLCGATEHPFARGNIPVTGEAESKLKRAKEELREASSGLGRLQIKQAETEKDLTQVQQETSRRNAALDEDEKRCAEALIALKIDAAGDERRVKLQNARGEVQPKIEQLSQTIEEIEEIEKKQKMARQLLEKARSAFARTEKDLYQAVHRCETAKEEERRLTGECAGTAEQCAASSTEILREVGMYGITELSVAGLDEILDGLSARRNRWQGTQAEKSGHERTLTALRTELEKEGALLKRFEEDLEARRRLHEETVKESDALKSDRCRLFGERSPDTEEKLLAKAVEHAEQILGKIQADHGRAEQALSNMKERITSLTDSTRKRADKIHEAEAMLKVRFSQAGFENEADYASACLPAEERERLAKKAEVLNREQTMLDTRLKDTTAKLKAEREKTVTDQPHNALEQDMAACEEGLKQTQQDIGAMKRHLMENDSLRARQQESLRQIEAQKRECTRWDALHQLIGSADGKKYRNFAQGLTFESMITHANRQLRKMSDRYLLVRDSIQPLELNVIDSYQAGEIRSTKNLSGGESFIVSLALALGLSHMAGRNVRVDSLFLDEGFGTLDEDALETALETLAGLQQDGKLIGVISHVPALKERISTQIEVSHQTGGRSSISGPGCRRLEQGAALSGL